MIDYAAGDLVVCIDASPNVRTPNLKPPFKEGALYRIACLRTHPLGTLGVVVDRFPTPAGYTAWKPERFRKARPDTYETDEEFLAAVRGKRNTLSLPAPKARP